MYEPILVAEDAFGAIDVRVRVKGGGHTSQVYAIRQAIAKAVVAYYAKYIDAYSALELKKKLVAYDRTLLIADPRRAEPKKFGGHGARARRQKRYAVKSLDIDRASLTCSTVTGERFAAVLSCSACVLLLYHFPYTYAMAPCNFMRAKFACVLYGVDMCKKKRESTIQGICSTVHCLMLPIRNYRNR